MDILQILEQYGFATVAAVAMGYFIWFIYQYVTTQIIEKLDQTMKVLIALIDKPYYTKNVQKILGMLSKRTLRIILDILK